MIEKYALREGVLVQRAGPAGAPPARAPLAGNHRRRRPEARRLPQRQDLRSAHADQSRVLAPAGDRGDPLDHPGHGPPDAAGQGAAGPDRLPAADRQDDPLAAHQPGHRQELSRRQARDAPDRRAARGSHRHAPGRARRGGVQQPGPRHRKPRAPLAVDRRALPPPGRNGQGRLPALGFDHPAGPGVQQVGRQHGPHDVRAAWTSRPWTSPRSSSPPRGSSRRAGR